jgi:uncharacterized membrane protein YbhN (UPF0104 family)
MWKFLAKLLVSSIAIYIVFKNINLEELFSLIKSANILYLILGFILIFIAQIISAYRMRYYLQADNKKVTPKQSIHLYFYSSFLNLFLPGGVGGDVYKVLKLHNLTKITKLRGFQIALSERASGLLFLILNIVLLSAFSNELKNFPYIFLILPGLFFITIIAYYIGTKYLCKEQVITSINAGFYSFFIQLLGLISIISLFISITNNDLPINLADYLIVFLVAVIVGILPISIGGIGIKEITFLYLSSLFSLDPELGIALSLCHFLVNSLVSLFGLCTNILVANIKHKH